MFAIVDAEMSMSPSAPRRRRSGASGDLLSVNGTEVESLIAHLSQGSQWLEPFAEIVGRRAEKGKGHWGTKYADSPGPQLRQNRGAARPVSDNGVSSVEAQAAVALPRCGRSTA